MGHSLIFGGTFDPIHYGHLIPAQEARRQLGADEVILVPAFISPHKLGRVAASGQDRLEMARLAIAGAAGFRVDPREVERGGPSYTIDTIEALRCENPGRRFTLLVGADQVSKFYTWHRVHDILAQVEVAVVGRPGATLAEPASEKAIDPALIERLQKSMLATPLIEISATDIRARVAAGEPIHFLVPPAVEGYVRTHGLYARPG